MTIENWELSIGQIAPIFSLAPPLFTGYMIPGEEAHNAAVSHSCHDFFDGYSGSCSPCHRRKI